MGKLAQQTIERLRDSSELRVHANVVSMDDTKVKVFEDLLTRAEFEIKGYNGMEMKTEDILGKNISVPTDALVSLDAGKSMDDLSRFTDRQLEDFDRTLREVEYGDIDILPVLQNTMIPVGATQHTFFLNDLQGSYKRITGSARDLPVSHVSGQEHTIKVEMGGGSLEFNIQEMDAANFSAIPLQLEKVRAVRRAYLQDIYDIVNLGNANLDGLMSTSIDSAAVADSAEDPKGVGAGASLKYWINKTGREIVEDLADARIAIHTGTEGRWGGPFQDDGLAGNRASFTCLLPLAAMNALYKTFMLTAAGGTSQTTWSYLNTPEGRQATGITNWKVDLDFDSVFQSSTAAGFMLLPNDTNAYSFVKAQDLTPLPVQFVGLSMIIPYYDYFAGLKLIRNKALVRRYSIQAP